MERLNPLHKKRLRDNNNSLNDVQIHSKTHFNTISKPSCSKKTKVLSRSKENKLVPLSKITKPSSRNGPRSKLSSNPISRLKKGKINLNLVEKCTTATPIKVVDLDAKVKVEEDSNTKDGNKARTPPIEASVSPEIHFSSHSKIIVSNSGATPVCYGAGHILSGVTDKRKCRRRGSLKGGDFSNKSNLLFSDENVSFNSSNLNDSAFPLLTEASVNWHLSPSDQREKVEGNELGTSFGLDYVKTDLLASRSSFVCVDGSDYLVRDDKGNFSGSFSSGNKIQTPDSDFSSDRGVGMAKSEMDQGNFVPYELGSMSPILRKEAPWLMLNAPGFGSDFKSPFSSSIPIKKPKMNEEVAVSYATTLDNFSVSDMKISWRDGLLGGGVIETDEEFDCCRCLSDEDEIGIEICEKKLKAGAANENEEEDDIITKPKILDYEPIISSKDKEKMDFHMCDRRAESICTNGASLVDSADSDWTGCFSKNNFKV